MVKYIFQYTLPYKSPKREKKQRRDLNYATSTVIEISKDNTPILL